MTASPASMGITIPTILDILKDMDGLRSSRLAMVQEFYLQMATQAARDVIHVLMESMPAMLEIALAMEFGRFLSNAKIVCPALLALHMTNHVMELPFTTTPAWNVPSVQKVITSYLHGILLQRGWNAIVRYSPLSFFFYLYESSC